MSPMNEAPDAVVHLVFDFLGPRDLCRASAVCQRWRALNRDTAANQVWQAFYAQRWNVSARQQAPGSWQAVYSRKLQLANHLYGSCSHDILRGHKQAARCVSLSPSQGLLASGSRDCTVKLWDLQSGVETASRRSPVGSVRSIVLDEDVLVVGGSDPAYRMCVWHASQAGTFDLSSRPAMLLGHGGPISSLALDSTLIYSSAWDYSVRMWQRASPHTCASVLTFSDWVWSVRPKGHTLLAAAGSQAHVVDISTGAQQRQYTVSEAGVPTSVEGTHDGRLLFATSPHKALLAFDLRAPQNGPVIEMRELAHVTGPLSLDDPWLAAATSDHTVLLLHMEACMRACRNRALLPHDHLPGVRRLAPDDVAGKGRRRPRSFAVGARPVSVALSTGWLAAGDDNGQLRTWRFDGSRMRQRKQGILKKARADKTSMVSPRLSPAQADRTQHLPPAILAARKALLASLLAAEQAEGDEGPAEAAEADGSSLGSSPPEAEQNVVPNQQEAAARHSTWDPWDDCIEDLPVPRCR